MMKKAFVLGLALLIPIAGNADDTTFYLMGGANSANPTNNSYVQINQFQVNQYNGHAHSQIQPIAGASIADSFAYPGSPFSMSIGLAAYYTYFGKLTGTEYPFINDGVFDSLNYQWRAETFSGMIESRFAYSQAKFQPFILLGIGAAWNHFYSYNETPTASSSSAAPSLSLFPNHTTVSFAYEVGAGLLGEIYCDPSDYTQYWLGLEYHYMDYGKGKLGLLPAPINSTNSLQVNDLRAQAVMLVLKIVA